MIPRINVEKDLHTKYPHLIIGSRFRNDKYGKWHFYSNENLTGDYRQVLDRKLLKQFNYLGGNDWEVVVTITFGD